VVRAKGGAFRFALESAPKGMTITDAGLIEWTAPPLPGAPIAATLTATDAANKAIKQTFTITVQ
jgi:hypothetical protein